MASPTMYGALPEQPGHERSEQERLGSSSPEPLEVPPRHSTTTRDGIRIPGIRRLSAHELDYSGDELAHYSDFSDTPPQSYAQPSSLGSFVKRGQRVVSHNNTPYAPQQRAETARNASQVSGFHVEPDERVIWHGYLLCLKTKGAVRQWKRLWVVLRPKNLAFYKNDEVGRLTIKLKVIRKTKSEYRNTPPTSSSLSPTSSMPWKSIPSRAANVTACK